MKVNVYMYVSLKEKFISWWQCGMDAVLVKQKRIASKSFGIMGPVDSPVAGCMSTIVGR